MARRRRDRVDSVRTGATEFDVASGTLPRSPYRDFEAYLGYTPEATVYLEREARDWSSRSLRRSPLYNFPPTKRAASPRNQRGVNFTAWRFVTSGVPSRVQFCVKRKQRREVLHAYGVAGRRGVGRGKRLHRSAVSRYSCR